MWLVALSTRKKERKKKRKEFIKHGEVVVECDKLAGVSVNVCGAAEAPKGQDGM